MMQQNIIVGGLVAAVLLCIVFAGGLAMQGNAQATTAFLGLAGTFGGVLVKSPVNKTEA